MKLNKIINLMCVVLVGALCSQVAAEVRVLTDRDGTYRMVRVTQGVRGQHVWSLSRRGNPETTLNIYGDRNGDLPPTIRESSVGPYYPWVVWSRYHEGEYNLAWSRWEERSWTPIDWVYPDDGAVAGDDLDADLKFDGSGRPYVTWWRHTEEGGSAMLSLFIDAQGWMPPFPVSEEGVDSRFPQFESVSASAVSIRYETAEGLVEQLISFNFPVTITEDINPLDFVHTESRSLVNE